MNFLILLEHIYKVPNTFLEFVFPQTIKKIDLDLEISKQKPDIMVLQKFGVEESIFELLPKGELRLLTKAELKTRIGISIIDIKHTAEDK